MFRMDIALSEFKMQLRDWTGSKSELANAGEELSGTDRLGYSVICDPPEGRKSGEVFPHAGGLIGV